MSTKTVTFTAAAWRYPDVNGINHTVTTSQTLTFEMTDNSATDVRYSLQPGQALTTTDGYVLTPEPEENHDKLLLKDAYDGVATPNVGDWLIRDPLNGAQTRWKCISTNIDNIDAPTTITATFESVRNNILKFTWSGMSIA